MDHIEAISLVGKKKEESLSFGLNLGLADMWQMQCV